MATSAWSAELVHSIFMCIHLCIHWYIVHTYNICIHISWILNNMIWRVMILWVMKFSLLIKYLSWENITICDANPDPCQDAIMETWRFRMVTGIKEKEHPNSYRMGDTLRAMTYVLIAFHCDKYTQQNDVASNGGLPSSVVNDLPKSGVLMFNKKTLPGADLVTGVTMTECGRMSSEHSKMGSFYTSKTKMDTIYPNWRHIWSRRYI